jgi:hypothetical protein
MENEITSFWGSFFKATYILFFLILLPEIISMMDVVDNHYAI